MKKIVLGMAYMCFALFAKADAPLTVLTAVAKDDRIILPLKTIAGFAFVEGQVNGLRGYFILDTGTPYAVFLNNAYLALSPKKEVGRGSASSGQKIIVSEFACLQSVSIATNYTLPSLCDLKGTDLGFVAEELQVPLLGFIGVDFFATHRMTLDWVSNSATIESRNRPPASGALASFHFAPADAQVPKVTVEAGDVRLTGGMDSGDPGHIVLTKADADSLLASKRMTVTRDANGSTRYIVPSVAHEGRKLDTSDLPVSIGGSVSNIMLGFLFLKNYRSTWDYSDHTVMLYPASTAR